MHVSPAKLPSDYQESVTTGQTDAGQSDPCAAMLRRRHKKHMPKINSQFTNKMSLWNTDAPSDNKVKIWQNL